MIRDPVQRRYYRTHIQARRALARSQYQVSPEKRRKRNRYMKLWQAALRAEILRAYGGECACCGESAPKFLAIDHINSDAHKEHTRTGGSTFYGRIKRRGFPPEYQLLCHNCNAAKAQGGCPHMRLLVA